MRLSKDYRRIAIAVAIIAVCMMMSPIPANANLNMNINGLHFNTRDNPAIKNSSFDDGLDYWTVKAGSASPSTTVKYDDSDAICFAEGVGRSLILEQEISTEVLQFANQKEVLFSFKFRSSYEYGRAAAEIGVLRHYYDPATHQTIHYWSWDGSPHMSGCASGAAAGSWVTVQFSQYINLELMSGLIIRIDVLDAYTGSASASIDDNVVAPEYVIDPGGGGGPIGYIDDAELAVANVREVTSAIGAKLSLVVIVRCVEHREGTSYDHAVIDIAFAANTNTVTGSYSHYITYTLIEVRMMPKGNQDGSVNVVQFVQTNDKGISVSPRNDAAADATITAIGWVCGAVIGVICAPVTGGASLALAFVAAGTLELVLSCIKEDTASSDTHAEPKSNDYYTRTKLSVSSLKHVTMMTISNAIDWYYVPGNSGYNLEIYGRVYTNIFAPEQSVTSYLWA